jgi:hypothetical protein
MSVIGQLLKIFRGEGMLPADGMVHPEDYDQARKICKKVLRIGRVSVAIRRLVQVQLCRDS